MKKSIVGILTASAILQAAPLPYKIFVETFQTVPNKSISGAVVADVEEKLKNFENIKVLERKSGNFYVVVIEGVIEKSEANQILKIVRSMPDHKDAFMVYAPDLLKQKDTQLPPKKVEQPVIIEEIEEAIIEEPIVERDAPMVSKMVVENDDFGIAKLGIKEYIKTVLETNPNMQERIYNYMEYGKNLDIAKRAYFPKLDLDASYGYYRVKDKTLNNKYEKGPKGDAALVLSENLFNGFADKNTINMQESRLESVAFLVAEKADRLSLEATMAYLSLIKENKLLKLAEDSEKVHQQIYNKIKERVSSGYAKSSEEKQAGSRLTLAKANLVSQQNNYIDAVTTFEKLYGDTPNNVTLEIPELNIAMPLNEKEVYDLAMQCNPTIKSAEANIRSANYYINIADATFMPKVDLEAFGRIDYNDVGKIDKQVDSHGALVKLKYNIFNKGVDSLEKEKRQVAVKKEQQIMDSEKRSLSESLKFSWQSFVLNQKKLNYVNDHVKFSRETLEAYQDEFKIGRRDLINLLDAENEYNSAEKEVIVTNFDLLLSQFRLLDNVGLLADVFVPNYSKNYIKKACNIEENLR